jgi:hypothetical protein
MVAEERIGGDDERAGAALDEGGERGVNLSPITGIVFCCARNVADDRAAAVVEARTTRRFIWQAYHADGESRMGHGDDRSWHVGDPARNASTGRCSSGSGHP